MFKRSTLALCISVVVGGFTLPLYAATGGAPQNEQQTRTQQSTQNPSPESTTELNTVVVTGSLIKHSELATSQPVTTISPELIKDSGFKNIGQLLTNLPSIGYATGLPSGPLLGSGAEEIDLRHLGAQRLLVLVNGHRFVKSFGGTVDLTQIPLSAVQRIEILQDGASAIYGSDAISGVVNIITKKNFSGVTVSAYGGIAHGTKMGRWDGQRRDYSVTAGHTWDRGHILFSASSRTVDGIPASHRLFSNFSKYNPQFALALNGRANAGGSFQFWAPGGGDPNVPGGNPPAAYTGLTAEQCPDKLFTAANGNQGYIPFCDITVKDDLSGHNPANYVPYDRSLGFNGASEVPLTLNARVKSAFMQGGINITPHVTFDFTALHSRRDNVNPINPSSLSDQPGMILEPDENPFGFLLSNSVPTTLGPGLEGPALVSVARLASELGRRIIIQHATTNQFTAGFLGDFGTGSIDWNWDASYTFASNHQESGRKNYLLDPQLSLALDPTCQQVSGCVPYDLFAGASQEPLAVSNYVGLGVTRTSHEDKEFRSYDANLSTPDLFRLPAGDVGFAVGFQYRRISGSSTPSALDMIPNLLNGGIVAQPFQGSYHVRSVYAELNVPLLSQVRGAERLNLDIAGRHSTYSTFGGTTNMRFGLVYQPVSDLLIRVSRSEGFRAATLEDLFAPATTDFPYVVDPCNQYQTLGTAQAKSLCAAQGVPSNYVQASRQVPAISGGNPNVQPEQSVSKTAGIVYSPSWAPSLNISLDYYHISLTNGITAVDPQMVLDRCYDNGIPRFCDQITRDATGTITRLVSGTTNSGAILTDGLDLGAGYSLTFRDLGRFRLGLQVTRVGEFKTLNLLPDGTTSVVRSVGVFSAGSSLTAGEVPRLKGQWTVHWSKGPWSAGIVGHYISGFTAMCNGVADGTPYSATATGLCSDPSPVSDALSRNHRKHLTWWDVRVGYKTPWNLDVDVGARNVLAAHQQGGVNREFWAAQLDYGVYSQFFYTQVTYHFE